MPGQGDKTITSAGVDYYHMHRLTGKTETVIIEYGFIENVSGHQAYLKDEVFYAAAEAVIKGLCRKIGIVYKRSETMSFSKTESEIRVEAIEAHDYSGKKLVIHHDGKLRFYTRPSWEDKDVFEYVTKGQRVPTNLVKMNVGLGAQNKVKKLEKKRVLYHRKSGVY